jgi:CBS domain-containing protein
MLAEGLDLAAAFLAGIQEQNRKVKSVMSSSVTTVTEEMPARDVASLMCAKNIKRVPVVRDGKLVGIVARSNLAVHSLRRWRWARSQQTWESRERR